MCLYVQFETLHSQYVDINLISSGKNMAKVWLLNLQQVFNFSIIVKHFKNNYANLMLHIKYHIKVIGKLIVYF